jgi:hypothetical protein
VNDGGDVAKYPNNANPSSCNFSVFNLIELCCKKKDGSGIDRKGWNCTNVVAAVGGVAVVDCPEAEDGGDDDNMMMMANDDDKMQKIPRINTTTISSNDEDGGTRCQ